MRSVRCDACGSRALMAASKCPKCAHEIEVRDGFGELLPLSHCSMCDSFYPERLGECRWCGTKPARTPVGPYVWKGVGIATFVAMAWGAWLVHDDPPADVSKARLEAVLKPDSSAGSVDSSVSAGTLADASVDSAAAAIDSAAQYDSTAVVASDTTLEAVAEVVAAITDSMTQSSVLPVAAVDTVDSMPPIMEPVAPSEPPSQKEPDLPRARAALPKALPPSDVPEPSRAVSESAVTRSRATASPGSTSTKPRAPAPSGRTIARTPEREPAPVAERESSRVAEREPAPVAERSPAPRRSSAPAPAPPTRAATTKAPSRVASAPKPAAKAPAKSTAKTVAKAPTKAPAKARTRVVWVNSVARNWVVVRASAERSGRVIASIGPNTRVQLGESRGGWRRIRAKGLAGWVEHRSFFSGAASPRRTGSLAVR